MSRKNVLARFDLTWTADFGAVLWTYSALLSGSLSSWLRILKGRPVREMFHALQVDRDTKTPAAAKQELLVMTVLSS